MGGLLADRIPARRHLWHRVSRALLVSSTLLTSPHPTSSSHLLFPPLTSSHLTSSSSLLSLPLTSPLLRSYNLDGWAGNDWPVITAVSIFGAFVAYIYSAPPLKLKSEGWLGTYALGSSYIALPWWCGHAMFNAGEPLHLQPPP